MTLDEFLTAFAACKDQLEWRLRDGGDLRGDVRAARGICCPITAVYYAATSVVRDEWQVCSTGEALGLHVTEIEDIVAAADANPLSDYAALRARLLAAVGLAEEA